MDKYRGCHASHNDRIRTQTNSLRKLKNTFVQLFQKKKEFHVYSLLPCQNNIGTLLPNLSYVPTTPLSFANVGSLMVIYIFFLYIEYRYIYIVVVQACLKMVAV